MAGRRRDLREVKDDAQDDHHARRHTPQCTSHSTRLLYPCNSGRNDDLRDPLYMYPSLLVSIKGGGGHPLRGSVGSLGITLHTEHTRSLLAPTSLPATHNSFSSRDLGASLPLSPRLYPLLQAPRCKIIQCSHTLLDVRPRGRNQDKPSCHCVNSCINHLETGTRSIITSWC